MTVEADEYAIDEWAGSSADRGQGLAFVETVDPSPVPDHVPAPGVSKRAIGFGAWLDRHDRGAPSRKRSDSGRWLDAHVWTIVAVAGALPALRLRAAWLVVCAGVAIGVRAVELARGQSRAKGSADLVVVPARVAVRMVLGALNPLLWLRLIFGLLVALTAGVLAAGIIAAAKWLITQGTDGILAATRMGVWAHTPTYAAFGACVLVVRGSGETHEQRAAMARRATCRLPEVAVAGLAVVVCVTGIAFTLGGPTLDLGLSRADGLAWVPAGLRRDVDGLRDQLVTAELDALAHCLNGHQPARWTSSYTAANPIDQPDVARLVADPARAPDAATLASAALAAQNVLAPWVERIEIAVGTHV